MYIIYNYFIITERARRARRRLSVKKAEGPQSLRLFFILLLL